MYNRNYGDRGLSEFYFLQINFKTIRQKRNLEPRN